MALPAVVVVLEPVLHWRTAAALGINRNVVRLQQIIDQVILVRKVINCIYLITNLEDLLEWGCAQ